MPATPSRALSPAEASARLAARGITIAPATLATKRVRGGGPLFVRLAANRVLYMPDDIDQWADAILLRKAGSTAQERGHRAA
jgi:hypothetical protein